MSKVVKGVKKAFKKVTQVVKKVAPVALAVGALVFTGGAALGAGFAAGGWGAAASSLSSTFGLSGALASTVTGAVTQAGYGALVGGTLAELGGGSFKDGATSGALTGAVTGGVMGGLGMNTDPLSGAFDRAPTATVGVNGTGSATQVGAGVGSSAVNEAAGAGVNYSLEGGLVKAGTTSGGGGGGMGGLMAKGGWLERNQELVGGAVKGLGQGLLASAGDDETDVLRERYRLERENYAGSNPSDAYRGLSQAASRRANSPAPAQKYDKNTYGNWEYRYNPQQGRIERVARTG